MQSNVSYVTGERGEPTYEYCDVIREYDIKDGVCVHFNQKPPKRRRWWLLGLKW